MTFRTTEKNSTEGEIYGVKPSLTSNDIESSSLNEKMKSAESRALTEKKEKKESRSHWRDFEQKKYVNYLV
jgi:hypothetical protein